MPKVHPEDRDTEAERRTEIGKRIRLARLKKGLQQNDFAQAIGVKPGTVSGWESGRHGIGSANLKRVVMITGEPSSYFLPERFAKKHTIERRARELGAVLGLGRLEALLSLPDRHLLEELDAIIGSYFVQPRTRSSKPRKQA